MYSTTIITIIPFLATLTSSFIIPPKPTIGHDPESSHLVDRAEPNPQALAQLLSVVPTAKSCDPAAQFAKECITAHDALQPILNTFWKYNVNTAPEQGALLALMAVESGEFKFDTHHFPSENPGQGTRNMMSPEFVSEYATDLGIQATSPADALTKINSDPDMSFGSAPWFYSKKCDDKVKEAVRTGGQAGFETFTTECVQTTMSDERLKYWQAAAKALSFGP